MYVPGPSRRRQRDRATGPRSQQGLAEHRRVRAAVGDPLHPECRAAVTIPVDARIAERGIVFQRHEHAAPGHEIGRTAEIGHIVLAGPGPDVVVFSCLPTGRAKRRPEWPAPSCFAGPSPVEQRPMPSRAEIEVQLVEQAGSDRAAPRARRSSPAATGRSTAR